MEPQQRLPVPEYVATEGKHLPTEDVALDRERPHLRRNFSCMTGVGTHDLGADTFVRRVRFRATQQQGGAADAVVDQIQPTPHARRNGAVRPGRQVHPGHVSGPQATHAYVHVVVAAE